MGCQGVLGAGRDFRYSGARRGIGHQGHWGLIGGVGCKGPFWMCQGVSGCVGVSGVYWGLTETLGTQKPEGYRGIGAPQVCRGHLGVSGIVGGIRGIEGFLGCRGVSVPFGGIRGPFWASGVLGVSGEHWGGRHCMYSGARRVIGVIRGHWELLGVGMLGPLGGVRGVLGWQVDQEPNHIGPQSSIPAFPLVFLGE